MTIFVTPIPRITTYGTPALTLTTANAEGAADSVIRSDADVLVFDVTVPVTLASLDAAAVGVATTAPRRDHVHGMPAIMSNPLGANLDAGNFSILNIGAAGVDISGTAAVFNVVGYEMGIGRLNDGSVALAVQAPNAVFSGTSTSAGANGVDMSFVSNSASPAANDNIFTTNYTGNDSGGTARAMAQMQVRSVDPLATSMDSELRFSVQDNVNAGNTNTTGILSSLGVWTDASAEASKAYEGDAETVWGGRSGRVITDLMRKVLVQRYHSASLPQGKEIAERHVSPTAEQMWDLFGVGRDPRKIVLNQDGEDVNTPQLSPKDVASIAFWGVNEHDVRLEAIEQRLGI